MTVRKKGLSNNSLTINLITIPFFLIGVETIFLLATISGITGNFHGIKELLSYHSGHRYNLFLFHLAIAFIPIIAWYLPVYRFIRNEDPDLKEKVKARLAGLYGSIRNYFILIFLVKSLFHIAYYRSVIQWGVFFRIIFPAFLVSHLIQYFYVIAYVDNILAGSPTFLLTLFDRENLYTIKDGTNLTLRKKLLFLFLGTAVIPLILVFFMVKNAGSVTPELLQMIQNMLIQCFVFIIIGLTFFSNSIQKPVDGLIEKMSLLAGGDFNVKTTIFFTDEIARLKNGFNIMTDQLKDREELRETFGKYVSIEIAKQLMERKDLKLGGEFVDAAVLFCDIRNFTSMSEKRSAAEVIEFLNRYFAYITEPIMKNHGVINKFIGDAVMAIFVPMFGSEKFVDDAICSALGMREAIRKFNEDITEYGVVRLGIGLHSGTLIAGNLGTRDRMEYTVIGDTVNLASRVESQTGKLGVDILMTEDFHRCIDPGIRGRIEFKSWEPIHVKGKEKPVNLISVV